MARNVSSILQLTTELSKYGKCLQERDQIRNSLDNES